MKITRYGLLILTVAPLAAQSLKFDFVSDKAAPDFRKVPAGTLDIPSEPAADAQRPYGQ